MPHALGGDATVGNIRLRCRTHNQLEAERTYGDVFMERKREHGPATVAAPPQADGLRAAGT